MIISFSKALEIHNFPALTKEEYLDRLGGNIDEIVSLILKDKNSPENIEILKETYEKIYYSRFDLIRKAYKVSGISKDAEFKAFCEENAFWLTDYTLYTAVKRK